MVQASCYWRNTHYNGQHASGSVGYSDWIVIGFVPYLTAQSTSCDSSARSGSAESCTSAATECRLMRRRRLRFNGWSDVVNFLPTFKSQLKSHLFSAYFTLIFWTLFSGLNFVKWLKCFAFSHYNPNVNVIDDGKSEWSKMLSKLDKLDKLNDEIRTKYWHNDGFLLPTTPCRSAYVWVKAKTKEDFCVASIWNAVHSSYFRRLAGEFSVYCVLCLVNCRSLGKLVTEPVTQFFRLFGVDDYL